MNTFRAKSAKKKQRKEAQRESSIPLRPLRNIFAAFA